MTFITRQHKILGVVFLALVVLSGYLVYATFTKKFADYDEVKVETSVIGLQLPARADGKIPRVNLAPSAVAVMSSTSPTMTPRIFTSARAGSCKPITDVSTVTSS